MKSELNYLIGEITSDFIRVEFLLSDISFKIKHTSTHLHFFANSKTEKKINDLKKFIELNKNSIFHSEKLLKSISKFDLLRKERNKIVHSLVLLNSQNQDEYRRFHYKLIKGELEQEIGNFSLEDLKQVHKEFVSVHNEIYSLIS